MSSADLIRELKKAGWRLARVNGSHHVFTHPQHTGIVVVPHPKKDLGIGLEKAMAKAEEAIAAWIETALDMGQDIPQPSSVDALRKKHKQWRTWLWAVVKVDPAVLDDTLERVNISLPRRVLHRLDALARATGETRSGFIARMALEGHQANT
jgi:predicted RNA binding protein YcfA (HicA-like mRNA interferase family)